MTRFQKSFPNKFFRAWLVVLAAAAPILAQQIPAAGVAQIQSLLQEKAARTPAQQKLDSHILYNAKIANGQGLPAGLSPGFRPSSLETSAEGLIHVDIQADVTAGLLSAIVALGGRVESSFAQYQAVRAWIPLLMAETLAARSDVRFIGLAAPGFTNLIRPVIRSVPRPSPLVRQANVRTQLARALPALAVARGFEPSVSTNVIGSDTTGVKAHGADLVQANGITGTGVKIGVLSDAIDSRLSEQNAGRLPAVTVIQGQGGEGGDEGTAMLEIVYSMAPGAQLYFATARGGQAQFAANIQALRSAGCDIIVDDFFYPDEAAFQDGTVAKAVNTVTAVGALYLVSAGNTGNLDSNASGTWEGDFASGGTTALESGLIHSFGATNYDVLTTKGLAYALHWSDPLGGACDDYDLFILDPTGTNVEDFSTNRQTCTQDPLEFIGDSGRIALNSRIVIVKFSGAARALHLGTVRGRLSIGTAGATVGHNAAASALTVAATDVRTAGGGLFTGGTANPPETFSADGPRKIFFDPNGNPITPNNFLFGTNGGTTLVKVDFTAADCVPSGVSGFNPFCGTSAAAPHAAAIAALVKSVNTSQTAAQVRNAMISTALPVSNYNARTVGAGIVMANRAVGAVGTPDLTIAKTHLSNFTQGQFGATYTITVTNSGAGLTSGAVTVIDTVPTGLTATALAGTGWSCVLGTLTCTRSDALAAGASYPALTLTVNVAANAAASVTNTATVAGGGETNTANDTANDVTTINPVSGTPDLTITKTHVGNFTQGQTGATYTITVTNSGTAATSGTVTVTDTIPAGLTATTISGTGWTCTQPSGSCTRSDALSAGASYPGITLTINVAANAAASVTNIATVSGGGETNANNDTARDPTTITSPQATPPTADSVTPSSSTGPNQSFTFKYSSANGFAYLNAVYALINNSLTVPNGCVTVYVQSTNSLYLANDAGSAVTGPITPGSGTLSNSQCTINGAGTSVSGAGNTLTVLLSISAKPVFKGLKTIYGYAADNGGLVSGWQTLGTWTPNPVTGTAPTADSVTPNNGTGLGQTFVYKYSSPNGFAYINYTYSLINSTLSATNGCLALYIQGTNALYLYNDAGTAVSGPITPGLAGSLSNGQCTIGGPGSSVSGSGNTLTLSLATSFNTSFLGAKTIYGAVTDNGFLTSGWQNLGSYMVRLF